jgi:hypothetical protein
MSDSSDTVHELNPSKSSKPAQQTSKSATVIELKPSKATRPPRPIPCEPASSSIDDKVECEKNSRILNAAVTYCCTKATGAAGFIADHTGDGVLAGYDGIVGGPYLDKAERSLRKLVKLMNQTNDVMTVELWSLAGVAGFILKVADEPGMEIVDEEMEYLKSFLRLVGRFCHERYEREWSAAHATGA